MSDFGFAHYNNEHTRRMIKNGYAGKCILFVTSEGFKKMITYYEFIKKIKQYGLHRWDSHEVLLSSIGKNCDIKRSQHYKHQFKLVRPEDKSSEWVERHGFRAM